MIITSGTQPLLTRAMAYQPSPLWIVSPVRPGLPRGVPFDWLEVGGELGFGAAANAALRRAADRGERAVILLNDDAMLLPGSRALLAAEVLRPGVGAAGAVLLEEDGRRVQAAGLHVAMGGGRVVANRPSRPPTGAPVTVPALPATALALRVRPVLDLEGFDERRFPFYFEDVDLCLRLRAAAWRVMLVPPARALHRGAATAGVGTAFAAYHQARGQVSLSRDSTHGGGAMAASLASALSAATLLRSGDASRGARAWAMVRGVRDGWRA